MSRPPSYVLALSTGAVLSTRSAPSQRRIETVRALAATCFLDVSSSAPRCVSGGDGSIHLIFQLPADLPAMVVLTSYDALSPDAVLSGALIARALTSLHGTFLSGLCTQLLSEARQQQDRGTFNDSVEEAYTHLLSSVATSVLELFEEAYVRPLLGATGVFAYMVQPVLSMVVTAYMLCVDESTCHVLAEQRGNDKAAAEQAARKDCSLGEYAAQCRLPHPEWTASVVLYARARDRGDALLLGAKVFRFNGMSAALQKEALVVVRCCRDASLVLALAVPRGLVEETSVPSLEESSRAVLVSPVSELSDALVDAIGQTLRRIERALPCKGGTHTALTREDYASMASFSDAAAPACSLRPVPPSLRADPSTSSMGSLVRPGRRIVEVPMR